MSETAAAASVFPALHADFLRASVGRAASPAVDRLRTAALQRFEERGLPTTRDEQWRNTSVAPIARAAFRLPTASAVDAARLAAFRLEEAYEAVFVNGRFAPSLSTLSGLGEGVQVTSLAAFLGAPGSVAGPLAQIASVDGQPFTALNTAFLEDGAYVRLAPQAVADKPIHLLFYSTNPDATAPTLSHPRTLIDAARGSQARIIETFAGPAGEAYFTNAVTEIAVGEGAVVEHYKRQIESDRAFHVGRIEGRQARASQLHSFSFALGASLARTDVNVRLEAEGGECGMYGLYLGRGSQLLDHHTLIDHAAPRCSSREVYKGVLDERSRGVFFGTILVRPDAQKTDAHQTNKNLLLSREALVDSTPRLQIEADDVRCKHGSTTGQLDALALFYLRSRGIGEAEARRLLTYAFAADVMDRVAVPSLRRALAASLDALLPGAGSPS
jgi:Fe-S cluster assembly protein SufD